MAEREARLDLDAPVVDVQVRAANATSLDPHDRVARAQQLGLGDILHRDPAGLLERDRAHAARTLDDWRLRLRAQRLGVHVAGSFHR